MVDRRNVAIVLAFPAANERSVRSPPHHSREIRLAGGRGIVLLRSEFSMHPSAHAPNHVLPCSNTGQMVNIGLRRDGPLQRDGSRGSWEGREGGRERGRCGHEPRWISGILCGEFRRQAEISHRRVASVPSLPSPTTHNICGFWRDGARRGAAWQRGTDARLSYFRRRKKTIPTRRRP